MSTSEEDNEATMDLDQRYIDLCNAVNMDKPTREHAFQDFQNISRNYTLEGDPLHWLVCALYVKSRESEVPTISGITNKGNFISLNKLLSAAKLNFVSFLRKMEKWLEMNRDVPRDFHERMKSLKRSFCVNTPIFKKFSPLFKTVFLDPFNPKNTPTKHKSRRPRKVQCAPNDIFKFCWTLFIHAKATQYQALTEDLLGSYQLLLSVINFCFANALQCSHRTKLLNPQFAGLPKGWDKPDFTPPANFSDIISLLVENEKECGLSRTQANDISFRAKVINRHQFTTYVKSLLGSGEDAKVLEGDSDTMDDLFLPQNFEKNKKAIDARYGEHILTEGNFDERIFLGDKVEEELGTPIKHKVEEKQDGHVTGNALPVTKLLDLNADAAGVMKPRTPLTNRVLLVGRELGNTTPVSRAMQSVAKLQLLLQGQGLNFSHVFVRDVLHDSKEMVNSVAERLQQLGDKFLKAYCQPYKDTAGGNTEYGEIRLEMIKTLYYKTLEGIIWQEKKRMEANKNGGNCTVLLDRDDFHTLLFGCCVEVVLFSYNSMRVFPWVLDAIDVKPYYFYKVIELIIRAEESLSRDVVKHLNEIEEQILERLAWQSDSPLWDAIAEYSNIPSCEDVNYPHQITPAPNSVPAIKVHPRVWQVAVQSNAMTNSVKAEPNANAHERFSSPMPGTGNVKRCLFQDGSKSAVPNVTSTVNGSLQKPKRTGSLALFFRKIYHMAGIRVKDLCDRLSISPDLQAKIWTCFEQALMRCCNLMKNRHMDQLIMCSVYVIAKVTAHDQSFQEIMRCYRSQPQACSHVYRSVLIRSAGDNELQEDERDDLIQFYNKVFVPVMKDYAKKFGSSSNANMEAPPLSPMPSSRAVIKSPRKVVGSYPIYVSPRKSTELLKSSSPALEYSFQKSPSCNLRHFNEMISRHRPIQGKRKLNMNDSVTAGENHTITSKLQKVCDDRTKLN